MHTSAKRVWTYGCTYGTSQISQQSQFCSSFKWQYLRARVWVTGIIILIIKLVCARVFIVVFLSYHLHKFHLFCGFNRNHLLRYDHCRSIHSGFRRVASHASTFCQQTNSFYVQIINWGNFIVGNVRFRLALVIRECSFNFFWMHHNVWERKNRVKHISGHYSNTLLCCWYSLSCSQLNAQHTECIQSVIALNNLPKAFMQHVSLL